VEGVQWASGDTRKQRAVVGLDKEWWLTSSSCGSGQWYDPWRTLKMEEEQQQQ
jgi:hypothetical protein